MAYDKQQTERDANLDPITREPGAHPVGTGLGAAAGGMAAGAAVGTVAGPIGTAVGAAVGAVLGGLAGKGVAEAIDPTAETAYWEENYRSRDYVQPDDEFSDYGPAYRFGVDRFAEGQASHFDEAESGMSRDWSSARGTSRLDWDRARPAVRDAWTRLSDNVERAVPGDSDRDGK